ncbi:WD40 repeat-like protein, partial [Dendrothele bispora CBS 962.96]
PLQGHTDLVTSVAYSPDVKHVASGSKDYIVRLWDTYTGEQVGQPFQGHTAQVTSVAYSPDGRHVASGSQDCIFRIWDIQTSDYQNDISYTHSPHNHISFISPQGWLCSSDENGLDPSLIFWIPPAFRHGFSDSRQILTFPANAVNCAVQVDWIGFAYGSNWTAVWNEDGN